MQVRTHINRDDPGNHALAHAFLAFTHANQSTKKPVRFLGTSGGGYGAIDTNTSLQSRRPLLLKVFSDLAQALLSDNKATLVTQAPLVSLRPHLDQFLATDNDRMERFIKLQYASEHLDGTL
jgi:hypothetical protein